MMSTADRVAAAAREMDSGRRSTEAEGSESTPLQQDSPDSYMEAMRLLQFGRPKSVTSLQMAATTPPPPSQIRTNFWRKMSPGNSIF